MTLFSSRLPALLVATLWLGACHAAIYYLEKEGGGLSSMLDPDDYVSRPSMTVLGFGRRNKDKFLDTAQTFSIGFIESTYYSKVYRTIKQIVD